MANKRHPLTEDEVDHYNHTWAFYLLLVLSLSTWLLPLATITHRSGIIVSDSTNSREQPGYEAKCWNPSQFTDSMIEYARTHCSYAFNKAIRDAMFEQGNDTLGESNFASHVYLDDSRELSSIVEIKEKLERSSKNEANNHADKHCIFVRTPLILFAIAVCLKLPHVVWASFSVCGGRGLSHLLESARKAYNSNGGITGQFKQDLNGAVEQTITPSARCSSLLYLLLKVITLAITLAGLYIVSYELLPRAVSFRNEIDNNTFVAGLLNAVAANLSGYSFLCDINIKRLSNIERYTIMCIFTPGISLSTGNSPQNELTLGWLYESILTILVMLFAVLLAINFTSLLIWIARLVPGPFRKKVFRDANLPMDAYLLLYMADQNVGPLVSSELRQCLELKTRPDRQIEELKKLSD